MKKTILSALIAFVSVFGAFAQSVETATEAVANMGLGWNLGNTLDAFKQNVTDVNSDAYWGCQGLESETYWGQKKTTKPLFEMMKNAGFGAIRVPITWFNHMDKTGKVNAAWMARVHEIVDMVLESGLYCIINVHHDTGADSNSSKSWIKADMDNYNANKERYEYLWKQIAEEFKNYDHHLLFEAYNEMLDIKSSWCFASFNTTNKYDAAIANSAYDAINSYAQSFVNSVRAVGGNNSERNLIICTYAAACGEGTWNSHLTDPLTKLNLPQDEVANHIIFEVHSYPNIAGKSYSSIKSQANQIINAVKTNLMSKGAPVIFGEWGTSNVDAGSGKTDYDIHRDEMFQFCDYFVKQTKANGMGTFYWMGLTDGIYRTCPAFHQPDLAECLAKAYHGDDFQGEYPEYSQPTSVVVFEGNRALAWGDGIKIESEVLRSAGEKCELEMTYTQTHNTNDYIQFFYGDWSEKATVTVGTRNYVADFLPHQAYGSQAGSDHVTVFTFPKTTYDKISQLGLIIHGTGITLKKMVVSKPEDTSGINLPEMKESSAMYNIAGQKVDSNYKGIVIKNGRKVIIK